MFRPRRTMRLVVSLTSLLSNGNSLRLRFAVPQLILFTESKDGNNFKGRTLTGVEKVLVETLPWIRTIEGQI